MDHSFEKGSALIDLKNFFKKSKENGKQKEIFLVIADSEKRNIQYIDVISMVKIERMTVSPSDERSDSLHNVYEITCPKMSESEDQGSQLAEASMSQTSTSYSEGFGISLGRSKKKRREDNKKYVSEDSTIGNNHKDLCLVDEAYSLPEENTAISDRTKTNLETDSQASMSQTSTSNSEDLISLGRSKKKREKHVCRNSTIANDQELLYLCDEPNSVLEENASIPNGNTTEFISNLEKNSQNQNRHNVGENSKKKKTLKSSTDEFYFKSNNNEDDCVLLEQYDTYFVNDSPTTMKMSHNVGMAKSKCASTKLLGNNIKSKSVEKIMKSTLAVSDTKKKSVHYALNNKNPLMEVTSLTPVLKTRKKKHNIKQQGSEGYSTNSECVEVTSMEAVSFQEEPQRIRKKKLKCEKQIEEANIISWNSVTLDADVIVLNDVDDHNYIPSSNQHIRNYRSQNKGFPKENSSKDNKKKCKHYSRDFCEEIHQVDNAVLEVPSSAKLLRKNHCSSSVYEAQLNKYSVNREKSNVQKETIGYIDNPEVVTIDNMEVINNNNDLHCSSKKKQKLQCKVRTKKVFTWGNSNKNFDEVIVVNDGSSGIKKNVPSNNDINQNQQHIVRCKKDTALHGMDATSEKYKDTCEGLHSSIDMHSAYGKYSRNKKGETENVIQANIENDICYESENEDLEPMILYNSLADGDDIVCLNETSNVSSPHYSKFLAEDTVKKCSKMTTFLNGLDIVEESVEFQIPVLHQSEKFECMTQNQTEYWSQKGISIVTGKLTMNEKEILSKNWENFIKRFEKRNQPLFYKAVFRGLKHKILKAFIAKKHFHVRLARGLNNRTLYDIHRKARLLFHPSRNSECMTEEEFEKLKKYVSVYGHKWTHIAELMKRTARQCEGYYMWRMGKCNYGLWSNEEDEKLKRAVDSVIPNKAVDKPLVNMPWKTISNLVGTRNPQQCLSRWHQNISWADHAHKRLRWNAAGSALLIFLLHRNIVDDITLVDWHSLYPAFKQYLPSFYALRCKWLEIKFRFIELRGKTHREVVTYLFHHYLRQLLKKAKMSMNDLLLMADEITVPENTMSGTAADAN